MAASVGAGRDALAIGFVAAIVAWRMHGPTRERARTDFVRTERLVSGLLARSQGLVHRDAALLILLAIFLVIANSPHAA